MTAIPRRPAFTSSLSRSLQYRTYFPAGQDLDTNVSDLREMVRRGEAAMLESDDVFVEVLSKCKSAGRSHSPQPRDRSPPALIALLE